MLEFSQVNLSDTVAPACKLEINSIRAMMDEYAGIGVGVVALRFRVVLLTL
jgi:hypothetical protein